MHLELVLPGLLGGGSDRPLPALELLLARGRRAEGPCEDLESWLFRGFDVKSETLPAGALAALALGLEPGERFWLRADPVHLRADRDRLLLFPSPAFALASEESAQLAGALERHFSGLFELKALRPDLWVIATADETPLGAKAPLELVGQNVDSNLPGKRWHALLNEIQMALYQHPVNTEREARGEPVVNSVWLWGGGRLPRAAASRWKSVAASDPVALGLARLSGARHGLARASADEWLDGAPADGRHLVVLDAARAPRALGDAAGLARALHALEERWFAPLLSALRSERIGMVTLHAPEAGLSFETIRGDLRRFWRRPRPLSAYASARGPST
jgi:hypothetical protein